MDINFNSHKIDLRHSDTSVPTFCADVLNLTVCETEHNAHRSQESHAFWLHPKVIVTPHVAAISKPEHVAECFRDNWERYHSEGPKGLRNVIDWNTLY